LTGDTIALPRRLRISSYKVAVLFVMGAQPNSHHGTKITKNDRGWAAAKLCSVYVIFVLCVVLFVVKKFRQK
jgi:hypothetical protein